MVQIFNKIIAPVHTVFKHTCMVQMEATDCVSLLETYHYIYRNSFFICKSLNYLHDLNYVNTLFVEPFVWLQLLISYHILHLSLEV